MRLKWLASLAISLLAIGVLFLTLGYRETYRLWGVPVHKKQIFFDLQLITGTAESLEAGYDPAVANPMDPGHRIFNYPKIWYWFLNLGIGRRAVIPLGIASLALFFSLLAVYLRPRDGFTLGFLLLVTFSGALMLAYERANVDLLFFSSVVIGLLLVEVSALASFAVMLLGILFKIYPVLAAGMYLDTKRDRTALFALASILFTILYFSLTWGDMRHTFSTTERGNDYSYGVSVVPLFMKEVLGSASPYLGTLAYMLAGLLLLLALYLGLSRSGHLADLPLREMRGFWAGAGIYVGTFLLGNNWDYRFMFTLLTVPALATWSRHAMGTGRSLAVLSGSALLISCWSMLIRAALGSTSGAFLIGYALDELANWLLFFGLAALLAKSLPGWLFEEAGSWIRRLAGHGEAGTSPAGK